MCPDHGEQLADGHHDPRFDTGEFTGHDHVNRNGCLAGAAPVVVPVHPEEVPRVRRVGLHPGKRVPDPRRDADRRGQLGETGQDDACLAEPADGPTVNPAIDDLLFESE